MQRLLLFALLAVLVVVGLAFALVGRYMPHTVPLRPVLLIAMLDETSSFVGYGCWEKALNLDDERDIALNQNDGAVIKAVKLLKPGDRLMVIGIDQRTFDNHDLRFGIYEVPKGRTTIVRTAGMRRLMKSISELHVRPTCSGYRLPTGQLRGTPIGTDIRGALEAAAEEARRAAEEGLVTRLVLCTDFQDDAPGPAWNTKYKFPAGTAFRGFYVVMKEGERMQDLDRREKLWCVALAKMGLVCSSSDFIAEPQSGSVDVVRTLMAAPAK